MVNWGLFFYDKNREEESGLGIRNWVCNWGSEVDKKVE